MTIYNSTNNISEDYTFIIDINEILYTQEELNTLNLDIYQYSSSQDNITWNTVNSSDIDDIYAILGGDLADLSNPNILDITADFSEILEESQNSNKTVLIYCGIQDDNRNGFPDFDDNQYFILVIHRNPESYYCIPIKSHILDNNIQIVDVETFEPLDFEYLSAKQVQNLIYSLISKIEILEFVETLPPKSSARTNCVYLLTETPSDPTDLVDDGLNLNFGLYAYSKTINDYKKLDTLTFNIKNFVKKTDIINNLTSTVIDAPLSAKQGKILNDNLASHIHGNIANDGKIGTSNNSNKNVVTDASGKITIENKPTIPIASTSIPSADTTNGSVGDGTTWARSNHTHPKSSLYAEVSHTHSQYLTSHQDITGKEDKSNKITSLNGMLTESDTHYPSSLLVLNHLDTKEDISNKVTSIYAFSTDDEYPSAKCVYDGIWNDFYGTIQDEYVQGNDLGTVALSNDYDDLDNKPTIPSYTSDLNNDSGFITISSIPSASSTTPSADTTNGSVGDGTTWARSNHTHPKSSLYAEASHTHSEYVNPTIIDNLTTNDATKVLSAKQGKVLNDLIGDAITYINGTGGN